MIPDGSSRGGSLHHSGIRQRAGDDDDFACEIEDG
jgi:hypothetical protein